MSNCSPEGLALQRKGKKLDKESYWDVGTWWWCGGCLLSEAEVCGGRGWCCMTSTEGRPEKGTLAGVFCKAHSQAVLLLSLGPLGASECL